MEDKEAVNDDAEISEALITVCDKEMTWTLSTASRSENDFGWGGIRVIRSDLLGRHAPCASG